MLPATKLSANGLIAYVFALPNLDSASRNIQYWVWEFENICKYCKVPTDCRDWHVLFFSHGPPQSRFFLALPCISTATTLVPNNSMAECRASGFYEIRENEDSIARGMALRGSRENGPTSGEATLLSPWRAYLDPGPWTLDSGIRPTISSHPYKLQYKILSPPINNCGYFAGRILGHCAAGLGTLKGAGTGCGARAGSPQREGFKGSLIFAKLLI